MSDWAAMIDGIQPALAGLDMNMPGFFAYARLRTIANIEADILFLCRAEVRKMRLTLLLRSTGGGART
jgi:hypothetical protein